MHKTNCMPSFEKISMWEIFSSKCPYISLIVNNFKEKSDLDLHYLLSPVNTLPASSDFCHPLITSANSLDPDQD